MVTNEKSIVSKGRTVQEAIRLALDILQERLDDVHIEILETESKGFLGIGSKPAVVKVSVKGKSAKAAQSESDSDGWDMKDMDAFAVDSKTQVGAEADTETAPLVPREGMVWVSGNELHCKDSPDKYPMVAPGEGVRLYKNEELVDKTVVVSEKDRFRLELEEEHTDPSWELSLSADKLRAILKIKPGQRVYRTLKDQEPSPFLRLETMKRVQPIYIDMMPVVEKLQEMGVNYGVDYTEIAQACSSDEPGAFVIAQGTEPKPGVNGYFHPLQELEVKKGLVEQSDGTVNYREIQQFPSVEHGQVLGIIKPPVTGVPGTTVTGELLPPKESLPAEIRLGKGAALVEEETVVVATEAGHPDIKAKGRVVHISIIPKLSIGSDVDLKVGNLHYSGEIEIKGSVQDGMLVEAQGNVLVHQNVNMAKVTAGGSLIVKKNVITSEATAGRKSLLIAELHQMLEEFYKQIKLIEAAMTQLSAVSAFKVTSFTQTGLGPLLNILYEGKYKGFRKLATRLDEKIKDGLELLDPQWSEYRERLHKGFVTVPISDFSSTAEIGTFTAQTKELCELTKEAYDPDCFIKAEFVHNSRMYTSGDIYIGQGVYMSTLRAGGKVEIDGYSRGGDIYAGKGAVIGETGTNGGKDTRIIVPDGETVRIKRIVGETVIQIGTKSHRFTLPAQEVYARIDENDQLIF